MPWDTSNSLPNWMFDRSLMKEKKISAITSNKNTSEIA